MTQVEFLASILVGAANARDGGSPIHPQAAAAHAANETGFGRSQLAREPHRNLFGVKATGIHTPYWKGDKVDLPTWEVVNGRRVEITAPFRVYASYADCFGDYGDVIQRVYPAAAAAQRDLEFLAGLFITGPRRWATDPSAFDKAARIIAQHSAVLYDDRAQAEGELRDAGIVVLTDFPLAHRWAAFVRQPVALTGKFKWRARTHVEEGVRLDVRAVRE